MKEDYGIEKASTRSQILKIIGNISLSKKNSKHVFTYLYFAKAQLDANTPPPYPYDCDNPADAITEDDKSAVAVAISDDIELVETTPIGRNQPRCVNWRNVFILAQQFLEEYGKGKP